MIWSRHAHIRTHGSMVLAAACGILFMASQGLRSSQSIRFWCYVHTTSLWVDPVATSGSVVLHCIKDFTDLDKFHDEVVQHLIHTTISVIPGA
ncbi:hypothetical protein F4808DRAFT_427500 [Astrocystis sublimbata]|nr:hypothetical protein F4808DRAFT_427500 [Astrocystis sublimbata]